MDTNEQLIENEISLRDIIETILKGKIIVAIITAVAIILSGLLSFLILPEVYESSVIITASPIDFSKVTGTNNNNALIEYLTAYPTITIQTYLDQILAVEVLNNTIIALGLRDSENQYIHAASLRSMITVRNISGTNQIEIIVNHTDPKMTERIANTMAASFIDYMSSNIRNQTQQAAELISQQLTNEEKNLNEKSQELIDFWKSNKNIDVLKDEVSDTKSKIVDTRSKLIDLTSEIAKYQASLKSLAAEIQSNPDLDISDFNLNINPDDPYNEQLIELNLGSDNLSKALLRVEVSHLQTSLIDSTSEKSVLEQQVTELERNLTEMQTELTESEFKFNAINQDMTLAQQSYDAYQQKYKDALLIAAYDIGRTSVEVTSAGSIPVSPVKPNKVMNILLAAVIGFALGIFIILFRNYWEKSKPPIKPAKNDQVMESILERDKT